MEKVLYSPDDLESMIDSYRFSGNWDAALRALERYAQVFDIGAATSSKQHWTSEDARCFYWSVMCEAMLEYKGSYEQAIVCAKKAAGYNTSYPDWRIFLCRIVLENAERAMAGLAEGSSSSGGALEGMPELDPGQVLGDTLQSMERTEGDRLRLNVRMMPKRFQQVLLHVFSILSSTEVLFICQNLLEIPSNSGETNYTPELWSVVCCRFILRQITLEGTHHAFIRGAMSDYRFWLISDAIVSRSILNEILGDLAVARADVMYVLRELSPGSIRTSSGISAPSGDTNVDMTDGSKGSIQSLPGPVRRLLLYSAARLPLLERDMGLAQESYKSFRHCIGADSLYRNSFPPLLLLGLHIDAAVVILRFGAGLKHELNFRFSDPTRESADIAISMLRESLEKPGDRVSSLADDVNLESALLLLRTCHEELSSNLSQLAHGKEKADMSTQFVNIELSWGASVAHNFVESELSIDFLPQSLGVRIPKPLSDPSQLISIVSPSRVAYLMAGIVTKIYCGTDQSSRRNSLTSTESFELLQWGFSNETTPPLNSVWALACCYLRLPVSASLEEGEIAAGKLGPGDIYRDESVPLAPERVDRESLNVTRNYIAPHFFGGEEVDASLELLDQCVAILLQRRPSDKKELSSGARDLNLSMLKNTMPQKWADQVVHGVDYPELSVWFGLGHQPSRHQWLPFSLAAELCLYMLEDGPRSLHYAGNGLRCLYDTIWGCDACIQLLCFGTEYIESGGVGGTEVAGVDNLSVMLLDQMGCKNQVPRASSAEGHLNSGSFSREMESEVVAFLSSGSGSAEMMMGKLKLFFTAAKAHACWGRNASLRVPERLFHRRVSLKALELLMSALQVTLDNDCDILINTPMQLSVILPIEAILLEYCAILGEVGETSRAIMILQAATKLFGNCGELFHLLCILLDTVSSEAINSKIHESSWSACRTAMVLLKKESVWSYLNCKLTMAKILWKFEEREKALREIDEILSELHKLTITGALMAFSLSDSSNSYHTIYRHHSRYSRAFLIVEILLISGAYFRQVQNLGRAKACIEDAWRLLFASRDVMSAGGSTGGGGGLLWGNSFEDKFKYQSFSMSKSLSADVSESAKLALIGENAGQILHAHTYWLDNLRAAPTFEGWRLSEASGWGVDSVQRRSCMALVAIETAEILQNEANERAESLCKVLNSTSKRKTVKKTVDIDAVRLAQECDILKASAQEFVSLALSVNPRNATVLTAASYFELKLHCEDDAAINYSNYSPPATDSQHIPVPDDSLPVGLDSSYNLSDLRVASDTFGDFLSKFAYSRENSRVLKAMSLAGAALDYDDLNFDAWFLLGDSFEKMGFAQQASECYVRALERANFCPSRSHAYAL